MAEGNGDARTISLGTTIQLGALAAVVTFFSYLLQPIRTDLSRLEARIESLHAELREHQQASGHPGVLANLEKLKQEVVTETARREGLELVNAAHRTDSTTRLDLERSWNESQELRMIALIERLTRVEERCPDARIHPAQPGAK